jgi:hypothetical protein
VSVPQAVYRSAFEGYVPFREQELASWPKLNEDVGKVGGLRRNLPWRARRSRRCQAGVYARLALSEEREVRMQFGEEYVRYAEKTPRFVPRLRSLGGVHAGPGA